MGSEIHVGKFIAKSNDFNVTEAVYLATVAGMIFPVENTLPG